MAAIPEARTRLVGIVEDAVPGIRVYDKTPDAISSTPAVAASMGSPFAPDYSRRMGRNTRSLYQIELQFFTGRMNEQAGQKLLDEWASGDGPIIPALLADQSVVDVTGQSYGAARVGNTEYLGFSLLVSVEA